MAFQAEGTAHEGIMALETVWHVWSIKACGTGRGDEAAKAGGPGAGVWALC